MIHDALVPDEGQIYGWIEDVFSHGVRRPGYPADRWAEGWLQEQFRGFGLGGSARRACGDADTGSHALRRYA